MKKKNCLGLKKKKHFRIFNCILQPLLLDTEQYRVFFIDTHLIFLKTTTTCLIFFFNQSTSQLNSSTQKNAR